MEASYVRAVAQFGTSALNAGKENFAASEKATQRKRIPLAKAEPLNLKARTTIQKGGGATLNSGLRTASWWQ